MGGVVVFVLVLFATPFALVWLRARMWARRIRASSVWDDIAGRSVGGIPVQPPVSIWVVTGRIRRWRGSSFLVVAADANCAFFATLFTRPRRARLFTRDDRIEFVVRTRITRPVLEEPASGIRVETAYAVTIASGLGSLDWPVRWDRPGPRRVPGTGR